MIPFDFDYFRPKTLQEALQIFREQMAMGKKPYYFSGGTELITLGRVQLAKADAVIDLKKINEVRACRIDGDHIVLGSCLALTEVEESNLFPLLTKTASEIADHTSRNKITLGGNIRGGIHYREAVLPFLLADSTAVIVSAKGVTFKKMSEVFQGSLRLENDELLVQLITERKWASLPFVHVKRRRQWETGYPLVTVAALMSDNGIRVAVSGLCAFPFRSEKMENGLNSKGTGIEERIKMALDGIPATVLSDVEGSAEYRMFVLGNVLRDLVSELEGGIVV
ncbi:MAG: FAD binding domain-containing protein [Bacillota bacterium]|nr:FAD binding domain-containing protein [Bacillota bacterium]